jgi:hypothetical protein
MRTFSYDAIARLTHATFSVTAAPDFRPAAERMSLLVFGPEDTRSYIRRGRPEAQPARTAGLNSPTPRDIQEKAR